MKSNRTLALQLAALAAGMVMLAFASVPLYRVFCRVTGFGGTTQQRVEAYQGAPTNRVVNVTFNTDVDPKLPWKFEAAEKKITLRVGENRLVAFRATNISNSATRGTSTYNVTPHAAGRYISKVQCFCFEEQRLAPGQSTNFPVSFFIDPAILDDPFLRNLTNITLSYTFFSYESANKSKF
jgi:cytochrome c oxidase assembly protein subunit 11